MTASIKLQSLSSRLLVATLAGAMLLPSFSAAEAGGGRKQWRDHRGGQHQAHRPNRGNRHQNRHQNRRHDRRNNNNDDIGAALAIGVIGLAAGAFLGSALSGPEYIDQDPVYAPRHPRNYGPAHDTRRYRPAAPVVVGANRPAPWTPEWYRYCDAKYKTFNPRTGRFTAYSGEQKLCR
ncbi:BA14K family protein [Stappia sp. ES.058]|uniref:BA14K family protein n=1 Tax=Stappia sp. ES.058 TaxID=1881061 RepID=UPI00087CAD68|nr:BA14K family protein [Stappia sp. ES.058]SDU27525.1 BA14K-like protein [Stappia sp. ES.058]